MKVYRACHCMQYGLSCILSSADIFQNKLFEKFFQEIPSECQTVWIRIWTNVLSGLIWVQTVCKGYQQRTLGDKELRYTELTADVISSIPICLQTCFSSLILI